MQFVVVIFETTGCHHAKTAGNVRVGIVVVFLQERLEVGIYRKRDFELIVIILEFYDILSRFRINDLLWLMLTTNGQMLIQLIFFSKWV